MEPISWRIFVLVYTSRDDASKRFKAKRHYLLKGIIDNYNVIINGKKHDQPIDSDIKQYEEIRKLKIWILYYWMFIRLWLYQKSL